MKILALDLGSNCGVCVMDGDQLRNLYTVELSGTESEKLHQYGDLLVRLLATEKPDLVAFEEPMFFRGRGTNLLLGFRTLTLYICEPRGFPFVSVAVSTLKKFATGHGGAKKPAMIQAAEEATGLEGLTEHEADAYHVGCWALANVDEEAVV